MQDLQTLFNELQKIKDEQKAIRKDYRDMLANDSEYQAKKDAYDTARIAKKDVELSNQASMGGSYERLEDLNREKAAIEEMISDIAMTQLMKGEAVEVTDSNHTLYEPAYKVSFKRAD